ncbi:MAG: hypothetical protein KAW17_05050 [Candidatus Eisenbacteria sp.]|nr:hypothetical protein [Candidatus Eisenbacteria bacterium]
MRVGYGVPLPPPEGTGVEREDARKHPQRASTSSGRPDKVQISTEARDLHSGLAGRAEHVDGVREPADARLELIRGRIEQGFYDSSGVQERVVDAILDLYVP